VPSHPPDEGPATGSPADRDVADGSLLPIPIRATNSPAVEVVPVQPGQIATIGQPIRGRRRKAWRAAFLEAIATTLDVQAAAAAVGVDRTTPYLTARRDPGFQAAWAAAEAIAAAQLKAEGYRRALNGSDTLLLAYLKAYFPEQFGDKLGVQVDVRREAERLAAEFDMPADEILSLYEKRLRESGR